ncbi:hypothetical protein SLA2020_220850 [Shorea laevis]
MGKEREAVVVCSDRNMGIGITVWDIQTGERLLHIPTCAASPHGLLCLRNQFLVASQINRHGTLGGGAIFMWPLNKPQSPCRSYTMEAIGPLCCTKDGVYIAGAAPSGNTYIWEVSSGRLLKTWRAHHKSFKCMVFSDDGSLLFCGSEDGIIYLWSMISLLDVDDSGSFPSLLHYLSEHSSSITGLLTLTRSCGTNSIFISSSLDGTCKVWDLISGRLLQTQVHPTSITAITLHPVEQILFSGTMDGRIIVNELDVGAGEDSLIVKEDQALLPEGHNGSITALTFSGLGLISASEDCTFCLWDVTNRVIVRRFNYQKGAVTNALVIKLSSLLPMPNQLRVSSQFRISSLEKCPPSDKMSRGMVASLSVCLSPNELTSTEFQRTSLLDHQIFHSEQQQTPTAMQMKVDRSMSDRIWATSMTKHVMEINRHLQSRLLNLMESRLSWPNENSKRNKPIIENPEDLEKQFQSSG